MNLLTNIDLIRYLRSSRKYPEPLCSFSFTLKIKGTVVHSKKKKVKKKYFLKNGSMILIQFGRFIVHSNPNNMTLSGFPRKFPEAVKINLRFFIFCLRFIPASEKIFCSRKYNRDHRLLINENFIEISPVVLEFYSQRNKLINWVTTGILQTWSNVFVAILLNQQTDRQNVLLSVIWNPLLIKTNLSQIRILSIKREKVCAMWPNLLLYFIMEHEIIDNRFCNRFEYSRLRGLNFIFIFLSSNVPLFKLNGHFSLRKDILHSETMGGINKSKQLLKTHEF